MAPPPSPPASPRVAAGVILPRWGEKSRNLPGGATSAKCSRGCILAPDAPLGLHGRRFTEKLEQEARFLGGGGCMQGWPTVLPLAATVSTEHGLWDFKVSDLSSVHLYETSTMGKICNYSDGQDTISVLKKVTVKGEKDTQTGGWDRARGVSEAPGEADSPEGRAHRVAQAPPPPRSLSVLPPPSMSRPVSTTLGISVAAPFHP